MSSEAEIAYEFQGFTYRFLDDESPEIEPSNETNIHSPPKTEAPEFSLKDAPWTQEEIRLFREKCEDYFPQIGPQRRFSNIKAMFGQISIELGSKTLKQCEQQYRDAALKLRDKNRRRQKTNSDRKIVQYWTEKETNLLIDRCKAYSPQVDGNIILNRNEMWVKIAGHLGNKTSLQCKRHYYHIRKRIKAKVESDQIIIPNRVKTELELINKQQTGLISKDCPARPRQQTNVPFTSPTQMICPMQNHAVWSEEETALLINRYTEYISQIGPFKKFRLKREMWRAIAIELRNKSLLQCERHYYSTIKRGNNLPEPVKMSVLNHMKNKHQDHQITNKKLYEFIQTSQLTMNSSQGMSLSQVWTEEETKILFEKYKRYVCQIGPHKKFRYKKDMWKQIASEFADDKTYQQCEQQFYRIVMKYRSNERNHIDPSSEQEDEIDKTETHSSNDWLDYSSLGDDSTMKSNEQWMEISKIEVENYEISEAFRDFNNIQPMNVEPEYDDQINRYSESSSYECPEMPKIKVESIEISDDDLDDSNSTTNFKIAPQQNLKIHSLYSSSLNPSCTLKAESLHKKEKEKPKQTNIEPRNISPTKKVKLDPVKYLEKPETKHVAKLGNNSLVPKTNYLVWTDEEVEILFSKYKAYLPQIGRRFRYKKDIFKQIAAEFKNKTFQQCEQQYYRTIMKYKGNDLHTVTGGNV